MTFLPIFQSQSGSAAFHRCVQVLNEQLFRAGCPVAGQIQQRGLGAFQHPLPSQRSSHAPQSAVPSCSVGAGYHCPAQRSPLLAACNEGTLKGDKQVIQEFLLAQHQRSRLLSGHLKSQFQVHRSSGILGMTGGIYPVLAQVALQVCHVRFGFLGKPIQAFLQRLRQAVSGAVHCVQSPLSLLRPGFRLGQGRSRKSSLLLLFRYRAFKMKPSSPEHRVQDGINIVFHGTRSSPFPENASHSGRSAAAVIGL